MQIKGYQVQAATTHAATTHAAKYDHNLPKIRMWGSYNFAQGVEWVGEGLLLVIESIFSSTITREGLLHVAQISSISFSLNEH